MLMLSPSAAPKMPRSVECARADVMPLSTMRALTRSISSSEYLEVHNGTMPATTMKSAVRVDHSSPT